MSPPDDSSSSMTLSEKVQQLVELVLPQGGASAGLLPQVEELERQVLGSVQTGAVTDRVDALATALGHIFWSCSGCDERVGRLEEVIIGQIDSSGATLTKRIENLEQSFPCQQHCADWTQRLQSLETAAQENGLIATPTSQPSKAPTPIPTSPNAAEPKNLWCNIGQLACLDRASSIATGRYYGALGCQVYWDGRNNCWLRQIPGSGSNQCGMEWKGKPASGTGCELTGSNTVGPPSSPVFIVSDSPTPSPTPFMCNGVIGDILGGLCN